MAGIKVKFWVSGFGAPALAPLLMACTGGHEPNVGRVQESLPSGGVFISEVRARAGTTPLQYVELHNAGDSTVSLANFKLRRYAPGSSTPTNEQTLSGTIAPGGTKVIVKNSHAAAFLATYGFAADIGGVGPNGTGRDAYELVDGSTPVDVYGEIGADGLCTNWNYVDKVATRNLRVVRGSETEQLTTARGFVRSEWTITPGGSGNPGSHTLSAGSVYISEVQAHTTPLSPVRFVELCNASEAAVNLSGYTLQRYTDDTTVPTHADALTGTIPAGGTFVIAKPTGVDEFEAEYGIAPDAAEPAAAVDGVHATELVKNGASCDVYGQIGVSNPTPSWRYVERSAERRPGSMDGSIAFLDPGWEMDWQITRGPGTPGSHACGRSHAAVPVTGQTQCFSPTTNLVLSECVLAADPTVKPGEGQDGHLRAGILFPNPRFKDNTNGTVSDVLTGLTWLKNANCFNVRKTWKDALDVSKDLADGQCGLTDGSEIGEWRLPTVRELMSLIDYGHGNNEKPALSNLAGTGACPLANNPNDPNDPTNCPLQNIRGGYYWTSTTVVSGEGGAANTTADGARAWGVRLWNGAVLPRHKYFNAPTPGVFDITTWWVLPVLAKSATAGGPAPVQATGAKTCWDPNPAHYPIDPVTGDPDETVSPNTVCCNSADAQGQDGAIQAGVRAPRKRFTDNGDTVTDNLTGLTWLKETGWCMPDPNTPSIGRSWADALAVIKNPAAFGCSLPPGDWRLPNIKEFQSLIDFDSGHSVFTDPALPDNHPFIGKNGASGVAYAYYWSSTTTAHDPAYAWQYAPVVGITHFNVNSANEECGESCQLDKGTLFGVWPVQGPRATTR
jgi:hypothetical protein